MERRKSKIVLAVVLAAVLTGVLPGWGRGELLTEFDPAEMPVYWVTGHYIAEAVSFDVGDKYTSLDEVWLHYDVPDSVQVYVTRTRGDTLPPSLVHRVGGVRIPRGSADSWYRIDLREKDLSVNGELWVLVKNCELFEPPGMSLRGEAQNPTTSWMQVSGEGWLQSYHHLGVGLLIDEPTGIEEEVPDILLPKISLSQNHPNPFNPSTTISFSVSDGKSGDQDVVLMVHDLRGHLVRTLVDAMFTPGTYRVVWDGTTDHGERVASGIYFYTLRVGERSVTRKMTVLE